MLSLTALQLMTVTAQGADMEPDQVITCDQQSLASKEYKYGWRQSKKEHPERRRQNEKQETQAGVRELKGGTLHRQRDTLACLSKMVTKDPIHSVIFNHIALLIKTCHMLMAEPTAYDMFVFLKKNRYVFCWFLKREIKRCHMLMAQPSTYDNFQNCCMLTAEPSTYD